MLFTERLFYRKHQGVEARLQYHLLFKFPLFFHHNLLLSQRKLEVGAHASTHHEHLFFCLRYFLIKVFKLYFRIVRSENLERYDPHHRHYSRPRDNKFYAPSLSRRRVFRKSVFRSRLANGCPLVYELFPQIFAVQIKHPSYFHQISAQIRRGRKLFFIPLHDCHNVPFGNSGCDLKTLKGHPFSFHRFHYFLRNAFHKPLRNYELSESTNYSKTSLGFAPSPGPTTPRSSIMSMSRAARA